MHCLLFCLSIFICLSLKNEGAKKQQKNNSKGAKNRDHKYWMVLKIALKICYKKRISLVNKWLLSSSHYEHKKGERRMIKISHSFCNLFFKRHERNKKRTAMNVMAVVFGFHVVFLQIVRNNCKNSYKKSLTFFILFFPTRRGTFFLLTFFFYSCRQSKNSIKFFREQKVDKKNEKNEETRFVIKSHRREISGFLVFVLLFWHDIQVFMDSMNK